jgi:transcription initiation factor IIE alpha subunit
MKQYEGGGVDPNDVEMLDVLEQQEGKIFHCKNCNKIFPYNEMCQSGEICADCHCALADERRNALRMRLANKDTDYKQDEPNDIDEDGHMIEMY